METTTLKAASRTQQGKGPARRLRAVGQLPSVAYGLGGDTLPIAVKHDDLRKILMSTRGRNTIIDLAVDEKDGFTVMVKDYSVHPLSRRLVHADFIRIDEKTRIDVEVPFHPIGKSRGEAEGGTLLASVRTLRMRCFPASIPTHIDHDISHLEINDVVKVKDLTLPEGAEPLFSPDRKLVTVAPPRVEAEPTLVAAEEGEGATPAEGDEKKGDDKADDKADDKK